MSFDTRRLVELLPAIYRLRDAERGQPLEALLAVVAEQIAVLEEDLQQLYDDQFIETCSAWVVPYLGDLLGIRGLYPVSKATYSPRAFVANSMAYRRRKGTAALVEQLARDVTGWHASVVEYFQLLATTQNLNHLRPHNLALADLRPWEPLERLRSPFDSVTRTIDVRRIASRRGRYNIPNLGIFLWRIESSRLTRSPAVRVDGRRFLFSPLGHNIQLYTRPQTEDDISHLAEPINVPLPISRRVLAEFLDQGYYGEQRSLAILTGTDAVVDVVDVKKDRPSDIFSVCDLSDVKDASGNVIGWAHMPSGKITIDPVLGRIAFPTDQGVGKVLVNFHYGSAAPLGGGEYDRAPTFDIKAESRSLVVRVPDDYASVQQALDVPGQLKVVKVTDSGRYEEALTIRAPAGQRVEVRADNNRRPTFVLNGDLTIIGAETSEVVLSGLLITGGTVRVEGKLARLRLLHCTLVPGLNLSNNGAPKSPDSPSLVVEEVARERPLKVELDQCIVGALRLPAEGVRLTIRDSIVDALDSLRPAIAATPPIPPSHDGIELGPPTTLQRSTVFGAVHVRELTLASEVIFTGLVTADRKQTGCVRFSFVPDGSKTPPRYRCQPDLEMVTRLSQAEALAQLNGTPLTPAERAAIRTRVVSAVVPSFTSTTYGKPAYGQLLTNCPLQIQQGAEDGGELGALHYLLQSQRETNLRASLGEYVRFGLEPGIIYET